MTFLIALILALFNSMTSAPAAHSDPAPAPAPRVHKTEAAPAPTPNVHKPEKPDAYRPHRPHVIQEDEYGWNCFTMGNKDCGNLPLEDNGCAVTPSYYVMCPDGSVNDGDPGAYDDLYPPDKKTELK